MSCRAGRRHDGAEERGAVTAWSRGWIERTRTARGDDCPLRAMRLVLTLNEMWVAWA